MIRPLGNHILVEPLLRSRSAGGIHLISDSNVFSGATMQFKVLATGPGSRTKKGVLVPILPEVKPGDMVITHAVLAPHLTVDDHNVRLITPHDVLAVVPGGAATAAELEPDGPIEIPTL